MSRYLSWNASPDEVKTAEQRASKLQAFNTAVGTLEEMALEDIVLLINSFDEATRTSLLQEANIDLEKWGALVVRIEAGFAEKRNNSSEAPQGDNVTTTQPTASINSDLPKADSTTPLLSGDKDAKTQWGAGGMFFTLPPSNEEVSTPTYCFPCCPMSV